MAVKSDISMINLLKILTLRHKIKSVRSFKTFNIALAKEPFCKVMNIISKHILSIALPALILVVALGCDGHSDKMRHHQSDPIGTDSVETPHDKAFRYMHENLPFEDYIKQQLLAVEQLRSGQPQNDPVEILSQAGHMYMRHGDYLEAMIYFQEASDSLKMRGIRDEHPDAAGIKLHGNLSALFYRMGLLEEALAESSLAIETSKANGHRYVSDLWRMRSSIYTDLFKNKPGKRQNYLDSAQEALDMAVNIIPQMPSTSDKAKYKRLARLAKADFFIDFPERFRDSIPAARAILEDGIENFNDELPVEKKVLLGRVKVIEGDYDQGLRLIEDGLADARKEDDKESVDWILGVLADNYLLAGASSKLAEIYPQLCDMRDSLLNEAKINAVIGAEFRYRLKETKQEAERLAIEKRQATKIALYEGLALVIGIIAGAVIAWFGIKWIRKAKIEKECQQRTINEVLSHQQKLNATIEELNLRLNNPESVEIIEKASVSLNPTLLSGEDENEFRRAFNHLYPNFLTRLRSDFPSLTRNDELVCMMIYLNTPSIDIALCLGISRQSLNSVRYRIRKKLALDKETDLDTFIRSR